MLRIVAICLLSGVLLGCSQKVSLQDTEGKTYSQNTLAGKWIIINYWAPWCESCVQEIPELNHFYAHHQKENILLFGVNFDHMAMPDLKTWVHKEQISYPVLIEDPQTLFKLTDVDVLPVTFIINPKGQVVKSIVGANTEKSLSKTLRQLQQ